MSMGRDPTSHWSYVGASVRGPAHKRAGMPNQDAWLVHIRGEEVVAVVSDGLGSKPFADFGSRVACSAVSRAISVWRRNGDAPPLSLLRLVHATWSAWVAPKKESDCATTCLLAHSDGARITLAQLGDGMVAFGSPDSGFKTLPSHERDFSSETTGLGVCSDLGEWRVTSLTCPEENTAILLASDGVSEDLLPNRLCDFISFCSDRYFECSRRRTGLLAQDLRNWPTPGHEDDKTLVLLKWDGNKNGGGNSEAT